jgi:imidazolonepropionase-like amidohydrolase
VTAPGIPDARPLALIGGAVFDDAARTFRRAEAVCRDGRIEALGPGAVPPEGALRIDATGKFVVPGLIDCHVHITGSGDPTELSTANSVPLAERAWRAARYAEQTLMAGFTTVRDLGAADQLNIHLARAIESRLLRGPRMLAAGLGVTMTGGHGNGFIASEADGPDAVRKAVRQQLRAGATAIKLFASGGVMTPGVDPRSPSYTEDELRAGVEEAHKAFRIVGAHAQATEGVKNAIRAGVDSIEHGVWLDEEAIQMMCGRGTYLVATFTAPWQIAHRGTEAGIPAFMVDKGWQVLEAHEQSIRSAINAGVRMAMGTDQGTPKNHPGENAQEIVRLAGLGLSPAAALLASTAWAADLLQLSGEIGRIKPGLAADLLVLDADPLADISVLANQSAIRAVIQAGAIVRSSLPETEGNP